MILKIFKLKNNEFYENNELKINNLLELIIDFIQLIPTYLKHTA